MSQRELRDMFAKVRHVLPCLHRWGGAQRAQRPAVVGKKPAKGCQAGRCAAGGAEAFDAPSTRPPTLPTPPLPPSAPRCSQVYNVHTNSNNNTWLRRKLLEAVGASRRFYAAAASRAGRSRPKKASADGGSHATAAAPKPRAPKAHHAEPHVLHCRGGQAAPPSFGSHGSAGGGHVAHHVLPPGPALPAGSPRALSHRPRRAALGSASALGDASHYGAASYGAACFGGAPYPAYPQAPCQPQRRQCYVYPAAQHSDDTCSGSVGSEAHPAAIGSPRSWDSTSPTSAFAAAHPQPLMHPSAAAMPSNG